MEVGKKIVYPLHGAGIIQEISKEDFFGEVKTFCTLHIVSKDMIIKFPLTRSDELNIRPVVPSDEIYDAMGQGFSRDYMDTSNWNKRYQATLEKMKLGTPDEMAEVLVNLKKQDVEKGLSSGERQLYHNTLDILSSEIMLSEDITYDEALLELETALKEVIGCDEQSES